MAKSTVFSSFPGQLGVGCVRRMVMECDSRRRLERRVLPLASLSSSYLGFLPWRLLMIDCKLRGEQTLCLTSCFWSWCLTQQQSKPWQYMQLKSLIRLAFAYFLCEKLLDFYFCPAILIQIMQKENKLGGPAFCCLTERYKAFGILS